MLGGLLSKISASLGKSFLFAGLFPAAAIMALAACYWLGHAEVWRNVTEVATTVSDVKKISAVGMVWLILGFALFAVRTWILSRFQIMPIGRWTRWLLRGPLRKREQLKRRHSKLLWQATSIRWHERNFAPPKVFQPDWLIPPNFATALASSQAARLLLATASANRLTRVQSIKAFFCEPSEAPDVRLTTGETSVLITGLGDLYALLASAPINIIRPEIATELREWNAATTPRAKSALGIVGDQLIREWTVVRAQYHAYPQGAWIYPTILGNRIAALADYAMSRYGMDTATMWDRLWWILPASAKQEVSDARLAVEVMTNLVATLLSLAAFILFAETSRLCPSIDLVPHASSPTRGILYLASTLLLTSICYRGAVFAIEVVASKMCALIDMNRLRLLAGLGLSPATVGEELELFKELQLFLVQASVRSPSRKLTMPKSESKEDKDDKENKGKESEEKGKKDKDNDEESENDDDDMDVGASG